MSLQIKYAYKSHNTWVYRRTYPKHLQALLGSALKQSLKTGNAKEAKGRVAELNQTYINIISETEGQVAASSSTDNDETTAVLKVAGAKNSPYIENTLTTWLVDYYWGGTTHAKYLRQ